MTRISLLTAMAILISISANANAAQIEGPWCMHMSMGRSGLISKCDMPSYEACRAEMRAMGGTYCTQNPYYAWNARTAPPSRKTKHVRR